MPNKSKIYKLIFIFVFWLYPNVADSNQNQVVKQSYNLNQPQKILLKKALNEISGIVFEDNTNSIVAINDEKGKIYTIDLENTEAHSSSSFAQNGDFEDIAKVGSLFYVLRSDGSLFEVSNISVDSEAKKYKFPLEGNEFEGLYFDQQSNQLRLLCKECNGDKASKAVSLYAFDLKNKKFLNSSVSFIDIKAISTKLKVEKIHFKPSAIAIHPLEKKLYILSSVNKLLVKADLKGNPEEVWTLDPKLFRQPEGIAFAKNGDLYISNEADGDVANILIFKYLNK